MPTVFFPLEFFSCVGTQESPAGLIFTIAFYTDRRLSRPIYARVKNIIYRA